MVTSNEGANLAKSRTARKLSLEFAEAWDAAQEPIRRVNEAKAALKDYVDGKGETEFSNQYASVRYQSRNVFDSSRFKKEHPKLWHKFRRESVSMTVTRTANGGK